MGTELSYGLAGRRAIVTGHRGGIGGAIFDLLARDGVEVIGLDLPDFDLSDTETLEARLATLIDVRPVDILVNNAGVTVLGTVLETSLAETERVFRVNFLAAYALMRAVLPGMAGRRRGAIVNIASDQALIGKQVSAAYGASKAAIAQLSRSAALDWARFGIRVNCVAPGSTQTAMLDKVIGDLSAQYPDQFPVSSTEAYKSSVPLGRFADPSEIAQRSPSWPPTRHPSSPAWCCPSMAAAPRNEAGASSPAARGASAALSRTGWRTRAGTFWSWHASHGPRAHRFAACDVADPAP